MSKSATKVSNKRKADDLENGDIPVIDQLFTSIYFFLTENGKNSTASTLIKESSANKAAKNVPSLLKIFEASLPKK